MILLKRGFSHSQYRNIELYQMAEGSKYHVIILKKIPNERLSADVRKFYKSEKQAHKQFNYYCH